MATAVSLTSRPAVSSIDPLQSSLRELEKTLPPDDLKLLYSVNAKPDTTAVIAFTAQLDDKNAQRCSRCVASRLFTILESVQQFSGVVDIFVSSNPGIAGLVWGSVKLSLLASASGRQSFKANSRSVDL